MMALVYGFAAIGIFVTVLVVAGIGYCLSAQGDADAEEAVEGPVEGSEPPDPQITPVT